MGKKKSPQCVTWVETKLNQADALTKALALPLFLSLTSIACAACAC